jgi:Rad3-related DNA helicase
LDSGVAAERWVTQCTPCSARLTFWRKTGTFDFLKRRLGVENSKERILDSHFDYSRQALLYLPVHLPDPREHGFTEKAADEVVELLRATRGRAFVLFTSHQQMREVYGRVRRRLRYSMLLQGTAPRTALLDKFRRTPHAVLFATSSFWQGVDVQGQQLSAVIIDRLPFAVPTDPVVAARIRQIQTDGGSAFNEYQAPQAVISLKQGFGRLIRSETDRGILAILDSPHGAHGLRSTVLREPAALRAHPPFGRREGFYARIVKAFSSRRSAISNKIGIRTIRYGSNGR